MGNPHSVVVACFSSRVCLLVFVLWGLIMPPLAVGQSAAADARDREIRALLKAALSKLGGVQ